MAFQDRELACRDCGGGFVFTAGEQEFYATKGLQHDPVRCPSCRSTRKMMRPEDRDETATYGVFASWGGRTPRQLHVASCAQCAQLTEVPFVPRGDRPVYCSACYNEVRAKQEAAEQAAAVHAASRIASAASGATAALEGPGPEDASEAAADAIVEGEVAAAEDATAELVSEDEPAAEAVAEPAAEDESAAEAVAEPVAEDEPAAEAVAEDEPAAEDEPVATPVAEAAPVLD